MSVHAPIERLDVDVLRLPTEHGPETDGTATWDATTMVLVRASAGGATGLGYSYIDGAAAEVVRSLLAPVVLRADPFSIPCVHGAMLAAVRNHGRPGLVACAISAVDNALWDLKARLLGLPLACLLGQARETVPVYASGGFCSSGPDALATELAGYVAAGHRRVKIKIGREDDRARLRAAREAIGPRVELMVDANGAYTPAQAIAVAEVLAEVGAVYFEEPVTSDDLAGLRRVRDRAPAGLAIAAGEYAYDAAYVTRMLDAIDIQQADATRCLGVTGFLRVDALCDAYGVPLSAHCAPAIHVHAGAAAARLVHVEHFRDHARMEAIVFDGADLPITDGAVHFDRRRSGFGLELRAREARKLAA
ncbi:MAG TPA: enolase C-terminal domain-like protein [Kofleriaceae bacterium]